MKLAVLGGGGVRSLFLARSLAARAKDLEIQELVFMDNDPEKLRIYGTLAKETAKRICPSLRFSLTADSREALTDADYCITTIRPGGDEMRVRDERIALDLELLGQETTGAAGFSFAMRSVSALKDYCEQVKRLAKPTCKVFNFTNPAGVVSQTLRDMGYDFTYGICDAPSGMLRSFEKLYGAPEGSAAGEVYGLNHLSYFSSVTLNGKDITQALINNPEAYKKTDMRYFAPSLLQARGAILNEYLYYFYYREQAVANILNAPQTRGEQIADINRRMTAALRNLDMKTDFDKAIAVFEQYYGERENNYMAAETGVRRAAPWKFDIFGKDDGGYAGVALRFIELAERNQRGSMILCVPNNGAIDGLLDTDIVEITCDIQNGEAVPHKFSSVDAQNLELIRRVKNYERLASLAIREKSVSAAVDALTLHPLVNSYSLAERLVSAYIDLNKDYAGEWK